jgi:hypothetical protein
VTRDGSGQGSPASRPKHRIIGWQRNHSHAREKDSGAVRTRQRCSWPYNELSSKSTSPHRPHREVGTLARSVGREDLGLERKNSFPTSPGSHVNSCSDGGRLRRDAVLAAPGSPRECGLVRFASPAASSTVPHHHLSGLRRTAPFGWNVRAPLRASLIGVALVS